MNDRPVSRPTRLPTRAGSVRYDDEGSGPVLVLLSSGGHNRQDWDLVRPALSEHFRTIALDWPGHGESPAPDLAWTPSAGGFADVVADVVDAVAPGQPVAFLGNSVGGFAAARFAIRRPADVWALGLVASGGFLPVTPVARAFNAAMGRPTFLRAFYPTFARWYMRGDNDFAAAIAAAATANARRPGATEVLNALWRSFSTSDADLHEHAAAITAPTLAVWGSRDPVLPPRIGRRAVAAIPGARLSVLDTGHVPFATRPGEFLTEVLPFLRAAAADLS